MAVRLRTGDLFCVATKGIKARAIRLVTKWKSRDGRAVYNHAGMVAHPSGVTFEALGTIRLSHINDYQGNNILIVRPKVNLKRHPLQRAHKVNAFQKIYEAHNKQWYPWHRIPMMLLRPLARRHIPGFPLVCSELTAKYEVLLGTRDWAYAGITPDDLADIWHVSYCYDVLYEDAWR